MTARGATDYLLALALAVLVGSCAKQDVAPPSDPRAVIELRWLKAYPHETRSDVETGLLWGLSLLGAKLPESAQVIHWHDDRMTVDLARAQVVEATLPAWRQLVAAMKASGEYQAHGAMDVGRFLAITLGSSEHYYALTGATPDYAAARAKYRFDPRSAAIVNSAVALGSRRVEISIADRAAQLAFVAYEGHGSIVDGSFVPRELELLDMMPNGQLRFALYDLQGHLKQGASPDLTKAGKPAKCMWCHEAKLQSTFVDFPGANGYYDRRQFDALIVQRRELLRNYRDALDTQIRYRNTQDHTFVELLYTSFEEPSRERLAREWDMPVERVTELLRGKPTHAQTEYPYLGNELYRREDVENLAPYAVLAAPRDVREETGRAPAMLAERP